MVAEFEVTLTVVSPYGISQVLVHVVTVTLVLAETLEQPFELVTLTLYVPPEVTVMLWVV